MNRDFSFLTPSDPLAHALPKTLRAVVAFDGFPAGTRASYTLAEALRGEHAGLVLQPSYWQFDLLAEPHRLKAATHDALLADLIIVATGDTQLPPGIQHWIEAVFEQKAGREFTYVAIFGDEEPWTLRVTDDDPRRPRGRGRRPPRHAPLPAAA